MRRGPSARARRKDSNYGSACKPLEAVAENAAASSCAPGSFDASSILAVRYGQQLRNHIVADRDRIAIVAGALEEIRRRHLLAQAGGIHTMSKPLPSPVRFIISSSAASAAPW